MTSLIYIDSAFARFSNHLHWGSAFYKVLLLSKISTSPETHGLLDLLFLFILAKADFSPLSVNNLANIVIFSEDFIHKMGMFRNKISKVVLLCFLGIQFAEIPLSRCKNQSKKSFLTIQCLGNF